MTATTVDGDQVVAVTGAADGDPAVVLAIHHADDPPGSAPSTFWLEPREAARLIADLERAGAQRRGRKSR